MKKLVLGLLTVMVSQLAVARPCNDADSFTKIVGGKAVISRHVFSSSKNYNIIYSGHIYGVESEKESNRYGEYNQYSSPKEQEDHTFRVGRYILVAGDAAKSRELDLKENQKATSVYALGNALQLSIPVYITNDEGVRVVEEPYMHENLSLVMYRSSGDYRALDKINIGSLKYNLGENVILSDLQCEDIKK